MELIDLIEQYYKDRNLKYPTTWEALGWAHTELGEVYEILLGWSGDWLRNNPQDHPVKTKEDFAEELGDAIMMIMMAGYVEGVNPIEALKNKIQRKLGQPIVKSTADGGVSVVYPNTVVSWQDPTTGEFHQQIVKEESDGK